MQHLESARFSKVDRRMNGITSHKVFEVEGNDLVIAVPSVLSKDSKISFLMSDTSSIKQGIMLIFVLLILLLMDGQTAIKRSFWE